MIPVRAAFLAAATVTTLLTAACGERAEPPSAPTPPADHAPAPEQPRTPATEAVVQAEPVAAKDLPAEPAPRPAEPAPVVAPPPPKVEEPASASVRPAAFARCQSCHSVNRDDGHGMGPNLAEIMGARMGSQSGFTYSEAMANSGQTWTPALMDSFLQDPRATVPGTRMMAAPIRDAEQRRAIIEYLADQ